MRRLPAIVSGVLPVLYLPISVDGYILPRAALVLAAGGFGLLLGAWPRRRPLGWLWPPALAIAVTTALACALSLLPSLSLVGAYSRYESAPMRLAYLGLFFLAAWTLRDHRDRARVVSWFVLACCVVALEAVWQSATASLPRPDGNLGQPNLLGVLMAMGLTLAISRSREDRRWLLAVAPLAAGLLVSSSRSGWLAAVAGAAALAVMGIARQRPRLLPLALGLGILALGAALALLVATPLRSLNADTGSARLGVWRDTLSMVEARPLAGWGEDTMGLVFGRFQSADWEPGATFDRAHSQPLDLAAAQGLAGLLACAWFWAAFWWTCLRARPAGDVAALLAACAGYTAWVTLNFDWAPATGPFWMLAGTAWTGVAASREPEADAIPSRWPAALLRPAAVTAWAAATLALALAPVLADLRYYAGDAEQAVRLDPLQSRYHRALGEQHDRLSELRAAARLGEDDPAFWAELGDAERRAGDSTAARASYERGREIAPYDPTLKQRPA